MVFLCVVSVWEASRLDGREEPADLVGRHLASCRPLDSQVGGNLAPAVAVESPQRGGICAKVEPRPEPIHARRRRSFEHVEVCPSAMVDNQRLPVLVHNLAVPEPASEGWVVEGAGVATWAACALHAVEPNLSKTAARGAFRAAQARRSGVTQHLSTPPLPQSGTGLDRPPGQHQPSSTAMQVRPLCRQRWTRHAGIWARSCQGRPRTSPNFPGR